ncbi:3962_t:CDS:2, partial [Dentiscutata heterogama]
DPQFLQALQKVLSVNLTQEENCLALDKALETLGVKFLKENMTVE